MELSNMMNKQEVYQFLSSHEIPFEAMEHKAVYNMQEMWDIQLPHPDADAKNLFVRDDKKQNYYLITVKGEKRVDLKKFQARYGTRRLSFASDSDLQIILGLIPGAVTPFGILNDEDCRVHFYIDEDFFSGSGLTAIHPNDNTATVWLKSEDLVNIVRNHGNDVHVISL